MSIYRESIATAFDLVMRADASLMEILALSIIVSGVALLLSCLIGLPLGALLATAHRLPLRGTLHQYR